MATIYVCIATNYGRTKIRILVIASKYYLKKPYTYLQNNALLS